MTRIKNTRSPYISLGGAFVLLCLACASASAADGDVPLPQSLIPGMRVRILAPNLSPNKLIGTVEQVSHDSVTLDVPGRNEPVSILRDKIARLDVSDGLRSRGVDAAIGAGIGAAVGAAACAAANGSGRGHIVSTGGVAAACALFLAALAHWLEWPFRPASIGKISPRAAIGLASRLDSTMGPTWRSRGNFKGWTVPLHTSLRTSAAVGICD